MTTCVINMRTCLQAVLMVDRMISPFTLSAGPILFCLAIVYLSDFVSWSDYVVTVCIYYLWILVSRTVRMLPHFWRVPGAAPHCPADVVLPLSCEPVEDHPAFIEQRSWLRCARYCSRLVQTRRPASVAPLIPPPFAAEDVTYLPLFILYQYFFAGLKLYAAFTLNNTAWGTRDANAFKTPEQIAAEAQSSSTTLKSLLSQKSDPAVLAKAVEDKTKRGSAPGEKRSNRVEKVDADAIVRIRRTPPGADQQPRGPTSSGVRHGLRGGPKALGEPQVWRGTPGVSNGGGQLPVARGANDPMVPSPKRR
jgi:hypothetical protein